MYSPDTLKRLNEKEYQKWVVESKKGEVVCDCCDEKAVHFAEVLNPADEVNGRSGAYATMAVCDDHWVDSPSFYEQNFECPGCNRLFIQNHSWDFVAAKVDGELYCQKCAVDYFLENGMITVKDLLTNLKYENMGGWFRIDNVPNYEEIWDGEFSSWSDFPGFTSFKSLAEDIKKTCKEKGIKLSTKVLPALTRTYQFSVVLGIFMKGK